LFWKVQYIPSRFNPYFNGIPFGRYWIDSPRLAHYYVSILILMEYLSEVDELTGAGGGVLRVSILILMEYLSEDEHGLSFRYYRKRGKFGIRPKCSHLTIRHCL